MKEFNKRKSMIELSYCDVKLVQHAPKENFLKDVF